MYWRGECSVAYCCFGLFFCFVGLTLMLDCGIFTSLFFLELSSGGWYRTRLLRRFWLLDLFLGAGVLSLSRSRRDSLISSRLGLWPLCSSLVSLRRRVMLVNSFSILLMLAMSRTRWFFLAPMRSRRSPLEAVREEAWGALSLMRGNRTGAPVLRFRIYLICYYYCYHK